MVQKVKGITHLSTPVLCEETILATPQKSKGPILYLAVFVIRSFNKWRVRSEPVMLFKYVL